MSELISKAKAITDAKITFVSLVNKAANKRKFLITKAENGNAEFQSYGVILKSDTDTHYVTGVVYEPMTEDTDGNYMTESEIAKAEKYFSNKQRNIDVQHSFEPCDGACLVDSWITKCDCEIEDQPVKKGSWLMTVKVEDNDLWDKVIEKSITGFSMGGVGHYSDVDVDLEKSDEDKPVGIFKRLAKAFGYDVVKKGNVADKFIQRSKETGFWDAWNSLCDVLKSYNSMTGSYEYASDAETVQSALEDFNQIIENILVNNSVQKSVINVTHDDKVLQKKEIEEMTESEIKQIVSKAVSTEIEKAIDKEKKAKTNKKKATDTLGNEDASGEFEETEDGEDDAESKKSSKKKCDTLSKEDISGIVKAAVSSELKKYTSIRGKSAQIDDDDTEDVSKSDKQHYMHGIL